MGDYLEGYEINPLPDKQSQTKIDLTHRNILFGPQCVFLKF